jgi:hypothetical protein
MINAICGCDGPLYELEDREDIGDSCDVEAEKLLCPAPPAVD